MYYANCEWYVDMGKHNKPLCERNSLRPAKCSECPVYIRSIEEENARLRELVSILCYCMQFDADCDRCKMNSEDGKFTFDATCACDGLREMLRELGVVVGDVN